LSRIKVRLLTGLVEAIGVKSCWLQLPVRPDLHFSEKVLLDVSARKLQTFSSVGASTPAFLAFREEGWSGFCERAGSAARVLSH